jgi:hypothetical protein
MFWGPYEMGVSKNVNILEKRRAGVSKTDNSVNIERVTSGIKLGKLGKLGSHPKVKS